MPPSLTDHLLTHDANMPAGNGGVKNICNIVVHSAVVFPWGTI